MHSGLVKYLVEYSEKSYPQAVVKFQEIAGFLAEKDIVAIGNTQNPPQLIASWVLIVTFSGSARGREMRALCGCGEVQQMGQKRGVEIKGKGKGKSKTRGASGVEAKALTHGKIPGGMRLVDNAGQGNCLFLAISEAWGGSLELAALDRRYQALVGDTEEVVQNAVKAELGVSSHGGQTRPSTCPAVADAPGEGIGVKRGRKNPLAMVQWRYRSNALAEAGGPRGDPTFRCENCAYVFKHPSRCRAASVRRKHCLQFHVGRGSPGPLHANVEAFRMLSRAEVAEEKWQWKCPLCRFGLPRDVEEPVSVHARQFAIRAHRAKVHPGVTDAEYRDAAIAQVHRGRAKRRQRGAAAHNRIVSGIIAGSAVVPVEFTVLPWPVVYQCKEHGFRWKLRGSAPSTLRLGPFVDRSLVGILINSKRCARCYWPLPPTTAIMMVLVSTMNVNRALPTKVAAVAATFFATGSQVMALQKVGVNAACVVSTVAAFRAHGLRLSLGSFDGACHRTGLLSCVQGRQVTLPSIKHQSRYTAAVFEFSGAAGYTKVLVASTYGQASGPEEATFAVASDLAASGHSWVMVDGFNVGMEEDPMCRRRSELNYGWASFDMPATSVQCFATGC
ncbi:hypothetical protein AK812_SmicGene43852 [Symbiodinium microadriaticum]|uniref:Uncharacterized protein n=1 Tax=Symbiodinium microadriaticum TaxID=2951 RepID=A0A1Q9BZZ0_SYMMI|nr:hypothetical protein AK812_SmicGene43852 [Symbiodinium microadriaticum]